MKSSQPYLGVTLDSKLSWAEHVNNTVHSANKTLGFLRRNLWFCSRDIKTTAYTALVRPKLEYATSAWDPHKIGQIKKLEGVQRKAARFCTGDYQRESSVTQMLADLKWEQLETRRRRNRLVMLYKIQKGKVGINADEYIQYSRESRTRKTNQAQIIVPFAKTENYKNSFFVRTPKDWNGLQEHVVKATSVDSFKCALAAASQR